MVKNLEIPQILAYERTALVDQLVEIINHQKQQIEVLAEEIRRLKKHKEKPKIRASALQNPNPGKKTRKGKQKKAKKEEKKLPDREEIVQATGLPEGARFKGYNYYEVQELILRKEKVLYKLERWQLRDGSYVVAKLPEDIKGYHFGPIFRAYALHQHNHQGVTQPLLLSQLQELGFNISKAQLNHLLIDDKEEFHAEKDCILSAGLSISPYVHVDDTGARHKGKNGYCTHIGNELFAWFKSTNSKSRINFLEILRQKDNGYCITQESFDYMKRYNVAPWIREKLKSFKGRIFKDKEVWEKCLRYWDIKSDHNIRLVTEAALIGSVLRNGFLKDTVILSDDAGQFNIFHHALCWIHAERGIAKLIPNGEKQVKAFEQARSQIWDIYRNLVEYKSNSNKKLKLEIEEKFNKFCKTKTDYLLLDLALKRLYANKEELLLILDRPGIPLHNNLSERDIREYVKRRKISGSTRSDDGKRCRDTFASLKKTAIKLKVAFWDYLVDRLTKQQKIPWLPDLIIKAAANSN
jgi:hypothetical protein